MGSVTEEKRLGQIVQNARKSAGLTQQSLCQKSGLSYSTLAKIERGAIKAPSIFTIQHIAATLGISLDDLMQGVPVNNLGNPINKKISGSGVRFVFFDMNDCLVRFAGHGFAKLAEQSGKSIEVIESVFWQYDHQVCRGDTSIDELNTVLASKLDMMVDWAKYYLGSVQPMPGMEDLVTWVSENYHVGILTNTMPNMVGPMLENGTLPGVHYDVIVESYEAKALKPEDQIYAIAAERAGFQPSEILLIDDNRTNLAAAARLGWHTMIFDVLHPEESIVNISNALQPAD